MDRYRYFIFNHRSMVILGILQIACAGISIVCGFVDGAFRKESMLGNTRAPLWAGAIMAIPGVLALFSSQKKNPIIVNALIATSVFSCFTTIIIIVYTSLTLGYGEDDDDVFSHTPVHVIQAKFMLGHLVKGANIAILIASISSLCVALCTAYIGCLSLPDCMCYDHSTASGVLIQNLF
ncbi:ubiquitin carboxyl-terminal hydrolase 38 [Pelobates cultripes]|uniref:Ubiquitin carboxyl-terminal hydrolase 38 n=1 Tax=Pelobates cultripes TaxID=61616 RepID=A0AAD1SYQ1_PELCU|nr:ubiquitin carboxyl-terminal hydrolase 38 [Pelobates cultripes]